MSASAPTPTISEPSSTTPSILAIKTHKGAITKVSGDGLTGQNWVLWQVQMKSLLALCEIEPYEHGINSQIWKKIQLDILYHFIQLVSVVTRD